MPYLNSLMGLFQSATRSLHDALPISEGEAAGPGREQQIEGARRAFYSGFVAEAIDAFCATEQVDGSVAGPPDADGRTRHRGLLTGADLDSWRATEEEPLLVDFAGHQVVKTGPWGQGQIGRAHV